MISLSAAILVATCTATFGLHSSSSTTSSYSYVAFASALRSLTASSAEFRPPIPLTETPPVNGPMKPTLTLSFACAVTTSAPTKSAVAKKRPSCLTILDIGSSRVDRSLPYPRSNCYESVVPHPDLPNVRIAAAGTLLTFVRPTKRSRCGRALSQSEAYKSPRHTRFRRAKFRRSIAINRDRILHSQENQHQVNHTPCKSVTAPTRDDPCQPSPTDPTLQTGLPRSTDIARPAPLVVSCQIQPSTSVEKGRPLHYICSGPLNEGRSFRVIA